MKGRIETTRQEHFYEETAIACVVRIEEDNDYKVYNSTNIGMTQHNVSIYANFKAKFYGVAVFLGFSVTNQQSPRNVTKDKRCEGTQIIVRQQHDLPSPAITHVWR